MTARIKIVYAHTQRERERERERDRYYGKKCRQVERFFGQPGELLVCSLRFLARSSSAESLPDGTRGEEREKTDGRCGKPRCERETRARCETTAASLEENSQHLLVTPRILHTHIHTHTHTHIYIYIYICTHMYETYAHTHEKTIICVQLLLSREIICSLRELELPG